tara:strand:- start:310 stop:561 length:252 start_codon:yes stop_codon:yes gene_type:complete
LRKRRYRKLKHYPAKGCVFLKSLEPGTLFETESGSSRGILLESTFGSSRVIILSCEMSGEDQEYYLGKRLIASKTSVKEIKNG